MRASEVVGAVALLLVGCGNDGNIDDAGKMAIERNQAILQALPEVPGATKRARSSNPYYREEGGAPLGYTTTVVYGAPSTMRPRDVIRFYAMRLQPRWRCRRERFPVRDLDHSRGSRPLVTLDCARGSAAITIDTSNMASRPPRFEVVADSGRADRKRTG
jgi:hypothetical protein